MRTGIPWGSTLFLLARRRVVLNVFTQMSSSFWSHGMAKKRNMSLIPYAKHVPVNQSVARNEGYDQLTSASHLQGRNIDDQR